MSVVTPAEAARHLLKLKEATASFLGYVQLMHPEWKIPQFHKVLINALDLLEKGKLTKRYVVENKLWGWKDVRAKFTEEQLDEPIYRLAITMPPRHSKSTIATKLFPSYYILRDPRRAIMCASYSGDLAQDFGTAVRDYTTHPFAKQAFPDYAIDASTKAKDNFKTESNGQAVFVGMGGVTTGRPANLLVVDDPIKSREEADSATIRNKTYNYYISALESRKQPLDGQPPIEIVIHTRWHPDDLLGRLQESEDWKDGLWILLNFPAIQKTASGSEYALWPEHFSLDELKLKQRRNPREFASLYQQSPYIEGGNLVKDNWWRWYKPDEQPDSFAAVAIAADTAFKKTDRSDYSVLGVGAVTHNGDIYILDVVREKFDFPELKRRMINLNALWRGRGLRGIYIEDRASGQSLIQELRNESGLSVIASKAVSDKVARFNAVTPLIEGGRVFLPEEAPWLNEYLAELTAFPSSPHDDQVDMTSILLDALSRIGSVTNDQWAGPLDIRGSLNSTFTNMLRDPLTGRLKSSISIMGEL